MPIISLRVGVIYITSNQWLCFLVKDRGNSRMCRLNESRLTQAIVFVNERPNRTHMIL